MEQLLQRIHVVRSAEMAEISGLMLAMMVIMTMVMDVIKTVLLKLVSYVALVIHTPKVSVLNSVMA